MLRPCLDYTSGPISNPEPTPRVTQGSGVFQVSPESSKSHRSLSSLSGVFQVSPESFKSHLRVCPVRDWTKPPGFWVRPSADPADFWSDYLMYPTPMSLYMCWLALFSSPENDRRPYPIGPNPMRLDPMRPNPMRPNPMRLDPIGPDRTCDHTCLPGCPRSRVPSRRN
jgi:hypothetical protein